MANLILAVIVSAGAAWMWHVGLQSAAIFILGVNGLGALYRIEDK